MTAHTFAHAGLASINPIVRQRRGNAAEARRTGAIDKRIGARIRARRELIGVSQAELALAIGVSDKMVSKMEHGVARQIASRLVLVARCLKIPIESLFDPEDRVCEFTPAESEVPPAGCVMAAAGSPSVQSP